MNKITSVTRKDICDLLSIGIPRQDGGYHWGWSGKMTEPDFLCRLYDLKSMPSTDHRYRDAYGDIYQHRVNNSDWDDCWVFYDSRFNLMNSGDADLLRFLAEIFHPVVRVEDSQWRETLNAINELLRVDGYELAEGSRQISRRDVYEPREATNINKSAIVKKEIEKVKQKFDSTYINKQIELMYNNVESHPYDSIGKAKELIETCCIEILTALEIDISKIKEDMTKLATHTLEALNLRASKVEDVKKGANEIKKILGSLNQIAVGIAELRNAYGSGHGKSKDFSGLTPRHARLAVGSAANLVNFLWETYEMQKGI